MTSTYLVFDITTSLLFVECVLPSRLPSCWVGSAASRRAQKLDELIHFGVIVPRKLRDQGQFTRKQDSDGSCSSVFAPNNRGSSDCRSS